MAATFWIMECVDRRARNTRASKKHEEDPRPLARDEAGNSLKENYGTIVHVKQDLEPSAWPSKHSPPMRIHKSSSSRNGSSGDEESQATTPPSTANQSAGHLPSQDDQKETYTSFGVLNEGRFSFSTLYDTFSVPN